MIKSTIEVDRFVDEPSVSVIQMLHATRLSLGRDATKRRASTGESERLGGEVLELYSMEEASLVSKISRANFFVVGKDKEDEGRIKVKAE